MFSPVYSFSTSLIARTRLCSLLCLLINWAVTLRIAIEFGDVYKSQLIYIFVRAFLSVVLIVDSFKPLYCRITYRRT